MKRATFPNLTLSTPMVDISVGRAFIRRLKGPRFDSLPDQHKETI
jgi:hypothetical protein